MQGISINVSYAGEHSDVTVVSVAGYIDTTTAPEIQKIISEQIASSRYKIVVDLGGVDYISSTGWGVFISELREIRANNGDLVLAGMVTNVHNIYELMEFSQIIRSFGDFGAGVEYFTGPRGASGSGAVGSGAVKPRIVTSDGQQPGAAAGGRDVGLQRDTLPPSSDVKERFVQSRAADRTSFYKVGSYRNEVLKISGYSLGKAIVKVLMDMPYLRVREIAMFLQLPQYGGQRHKAHEIKQELKRMELLGTRERFEFVLNYRGSERELSL